MSKGSLHTTLKLDPVLDKELLATHIYSSEDLKYISSRQDSVSILRAKGKVLRMDRTQVQVQSTSAVLWLIRSK